jgi:hypothetical protein
VATRPASGTAVDHVSSVTIHGIRAVGLALAAGIAVAGGSALHTLTEPAVVHGVAGGLPARAIPLPARPAFSAALARPAVPDVPWLAERGDGAWIHGRGADPSTTVLPAGETGLAIDDHLVATTRAAGDGRSLVRFRDIETDAVVGDVALPIWVSAGAWTPAGLVVTGYRDASMTADGGLVLVDRADLTVRTLVEPGPFARGLGTPVARGEVLVSPSGRLVASNACGMHLCDTQVVDVETGVVHRPVRTAEGFLRALTDDSIVTTDDDGAWIAGQRIGDGAEAWRLPDAMLLDPLAAADGSVVGVVGARGSGWAVARLDERGRRTDVTNRTAAGQPLPRIWREVSTPTRVVVGAIAFDEAVHDLGRAPVSVLAVPAVTPDADEDEATAPAVEPEAVR